MGEGVCGWGGGREVSVGREGGGIISCMVERLKLIKKKVNMTRQKVRREKNKEYFKAVGHFCTTT